MDFSYIDKYAKNVESRLKFYLSLTTCKALVKSKSTLRVFSITSPIDKLV